MSNFSLHDLKPLDGLVGFSFDWNLLSTHSMNLQFFNHFFFCSTFLLRVLRRIEELRGFVGPEGIIGGWTRWMNFKLSPEEKCYLMKIFKVWLKIFV